MTLWRNQDARLVSFQLLKTTGTKNLYEFRLGKFNRLVSFCCASHPRTAHRSCQEHPGKTNQG